MKKIELSDPLPLVHIHGQYSPHDMAGIVGTEEGLKRIRDAIDKAIKSGSSSADLMTDDGEGYGLAIVMDGPKNYGAWKNDSGWGLPYIDDIFGGPPPKGLWAKFYKALGLK